MITLRRKAPTKFVVASNHARAAAHRQMALSALHADSSLSTRLRRYNAHMEIARDLEALGVRHG